MKNTDHFEVFIVELSEILIAIILNLECLKQSLEARLQMLRIGLLPSAQGVPYDRRGRKLRSSPTAQHYYSVLRKNELPLLDGLLSEADMPAFILVNANPLMSCVSSSFRLVIVMETFTYGSEEYRTY